LPETETTLHAEHFRIQLGLWLENALSVYKSPNISYTTCNYQAALKVDRNWVSIQPTIEAVISKRQQLYTLYRWFGRTAGKVVKLAGGTGDTGVLQ